MWELGILDAYSPPPCFLLPSYHAALPSLTLQSHSRLILLHYLKQFRSTFSGLSDTSAFILSINSHSISILISSMHWILWLIAFALTAFLATNYVAPWLVHRMSSNVQIRNVGLRSVRGLFLKFGRVTFTADRIALTMHRSPGGTRVGFDFQNVLVRIAIPEPQRSKSKRPARDNWRILRETYTRNTFSIASLSDVLTATQLSSRISFTNWLFRKAVAIFRAVFRFASVYIVIFLMRSLPALTQSFDTQLDQVVIVMEEFGGAHLVVRGLTLAALIKFTQQDEPEKEEGVEVGSDRPRVFNISTNQVNWRRKWKDSVARVWELATARTDGSASLMIDVGDVAAYPHPATPTKIASQSPVMPFTFKNTTDSGFTEVEKCPPPGACAYMEGPVNFKMSAGFIPRKMTFQRSTGELLVNLPEVLIVPDVMLELLDVLQSKSQAQAGSSPPHDDTQLPSFGSGLFSPPPSPKLKASTLSRWKRMKPRSARTLPQVFFAVLKGVEVNVPTIKARFSGLDGVDDESTSYLVKNTGFLVRLQLSEPSTSVLHQKWLGNASPGHKYDRGVFSFTFQSKSLVACRIRDGVEAGVALLKAGDLSIDALLAGYPTPWMVAPKLFVSDPNASFVAVEAILDSVEITEELEACRLLSTMIPHSTVKREASRPIIHPMPRLSLHVGLNAASIRLLDSTSTNPQVLSVQSEGANVTINSSFADQTLNFTTQAGFRAPNGSTAVLAEFSCLVGVAPVAVSLVPQSDEDSQLELVGPGTIPDPVFVSTDPMSLLGPVQVEILGSALGYYFEETFLGVSLDKGTALLDVEVVSETVLFDITRKETIDYVLRLLKPKIATSDAPSEEILSPPKSVFNRLPSGCSFRVAIPQLLVGLAGYGLRTSDQELSPVRGLALRTSVLVDYCYIVAPNHTSRIKRMVAKAAPRSMLELPQECIHAAAAHASEASLKDGRAAFLQISLSDSTIRCVEDDDSHGWLHFPRDDPTFSAGDKLDGHIFLRVPEFSSQVVLRRSRQDTSETLQSESCRIDVRIPRTSARVDLLHIYCALAAGNTIRQISGEPKPRPPHRSLMVVSIETHLEIVQVVAVLPRETRLFIRFTGVGYNRSILHSHTLKFINGCAWVHSKPRDGDEGLEYWDEFCRFTSWTVDVDNAKKPSDLMISILGKGARIRLPHQFVLSDLITDVTLAVKATKHLSHNIPEGSLRPMAHPPIEDAKKVPTFNIALSAITLEMEDDPLETKLNNIWHLGFEEQATRLQREEAFEAKVAAILTADAEARGSSNGRGDISPRHTVGIDDARSRLDLFNSISWTKQHEQFIQARMAREETLSSRIRDATSSRRLHAALPIRLRPHNKKAPLLRVMFLKVNLAISRPDFGTGSLADFMNDLGGLPRDTKFTLLVPLSIDWTMDGFNASLRDYPMPLLDVPEAPSAWSCGTTLVVAEEVGPVESVDWMECLINPRTQRPGEKPLVIRVPKTVMPVKTYANPDIKINSAQITDMCWGVSYNPALQDVMRFLDTISPAPRDLSPALGFWDKMRLILHWRLRAQFESEVHIHVKGSRDPYYVLGGGAGFVFAFKGKPTVTVGYSESDKELIQISSEETAFAIPDLRRFQDIGTGPRTPWPRKMTKICAKLTNGVRFGLGFVFERACGSECSECTGRTPFFRKCRFFGFRPHYDVALRIPAKNQAVAKDSYEGFRSDFIHFSISLTSPTRTQLATSSLGIDPEGYNIFHLTPKAFAHFWAWWGTFSSILNLPIKQGALYPDARPPSPKFGRHISTIKYRISLAPLFITHVYKQDIAEHWQEGKTGFVGVKAMVGSFKADFHQREQETVVFDPVTRIPKTSTHKPICAAEVSLSNAEVRAVRAVFDDPAKRLVSLADSPSAEPEDTTLSFPEWQCENLGSKWMDIDDFVETDWTPTDITPQVWMFHAGSCPHFSYFRTIPSQSDVASQRTAEGFERSKFGDEDTHVCLMAQETNVKRVQLELAEKRLVELQIRLNEVSEALGDHHSTRSYDSSEDSTESAASLGEIERLKQAIERLQVYLDELRSKGDYAFGSKGGHTIGQLGTLGYHSDSDSELAADELNGFNNVYVVHSPQVVLSNSIRNVLMAYYYESSGRRGFEYHMSARALKFIKEQVPLLNRETTEASRPTPNTQNPAMRAATALRRILTNESGPGDSPRPSDDQAEPATRTTVHKSHFCLLLRPQIALHAEGEHDSIVHIAAMNASLRTSNLMDLDHIDDPINGYIMRRHRVRLHGMQAFVPTLPRPDAERRGVPLEVLVDFRCESNEYERLVPQTDAFISYDRFNRLRLHSQGSNASGYFSDNGSSNEHIKYQTDKINVDIPRFTVTAKSPSFKALQHIINDLLLYTDPAHARRNEALETFLFTYDFTEVSSALDVVVTLQNRIRQLLQIARKHRLAHDTMDERAMMDAMTIQSELNALGDKLDFIFRAIRLAQEKARNYDDNLASALQLTVNSDSISYNMLGADSNLLAKLAVKGLEYKWTNRKDSTTVNVLTIKDLQALNGMPGAAFPEVLVAHPHPSNHPMVKRKVFAEAKWTVLPSVAQISVIERFELRLHPVKVQIERKTGREILGYISPKKKPHPKPTPSLPPTPVTAKAPGLQSRDEPKPRRSLDQSSALGAPPRLLVPRTSSMANLKEAAASVAPRSTSEAKVRTLQRSVSASSLRKNSTPGTPGALSVAFSGQGENTEAAEMRSRAKKRTFIAIDLDSFLLVLTYKGDPLNLTRRGDQGAIKARDFVPNVDEFPLQLPNFKHHHCTWSVDEFIQVVKSELKKNAVGVVLKGFNARITSKYRHVDPPRNLIAYDNDSESSGVPTPEQRTPASTLGRPPRMRTTSDTPARPRVLSTGRLNTSPESSRPPSSFNLSMTPASNQDSKSQRGRSGTGKLLNLFRHKKRLSADSSMTAYSGTTAGRQSLDGRAEGLREPDPEQQIPRSKSSVRQ